MYLYVTLTKANVSLWSRQNVMCLPSISRLSMFLVNRLSSQGKLSKCCWNVLFWNSMGSMISRSLNRFGSLSFSIVNEGCRIRYEMCAWLSSSNVFALSNVTDVVTCGVVASADGFLVVLEWRNPTLLYYVYFIFVRDAVRTEFLKFFGTLTKTNNSYFNTGFSCRVRF